MTATPAAMRFARRIGAVDEGGYRKVFRGSMPLLGGLAIGLPLISLAIGGAILGYIIEPNWRWLYLHHEPLFGTLYSFAGLRWEFLTLALGGMAIVALGLADDVRGLRARWKLLGQVLVALGICLSGHALTTLSLPFVGSLSLGVWLGGLLTVLWIVGLINAFNLIDGIDGLAAGIALIGAATLVALSVIQDNAFVALVGAAMCGSLLAYLRYNFPPARIFLGDTGSMFLGYALATIALMGTQKYEAAVVLFTPMLALGLPIFETAVSILRRYMRGVPIFFGDGRHTHDRLLSKGYSQPRVVLTLYAAALSLAAATVLAAVIPENSAWVLAPYALYAATLIYIAWLAGYLRPAVFHATMERRRQNKVFQALGRYTALRLNSNGRTANLDLLLQLCRHELGLRFIEIQMQGGGGIAVPRAERRVRGEEENVRIKSSDGRDIMISYTFEAAPSELVRQDVSHCLAGIFDQVRFEYLARACGGDSEPPL